MTTDPFTAAAEHEADLVTEDGDNAANGGFVAGALWARDHLTAQEPTDAEVEAAARLLNLRGWTCFDGAHEPGEYDQCEQCRTACTGLARSVINTARAARRDEEKPPCGCDLTGPVPPAVHVVDRHEEER